MVNSPTASGQSIPSGEERTPGDRPSDNALPENSQENLDTRLDHAIEETFPTSDPVSVTITKGPEPDRPDQESRSSSVDDEQRQPQQDLAEQLLDQVRETLRDVTDGASGAAREAYKQGEHYARQVHDQYPEAERYLRKGQQAVTHRVTQNPLLALFMAGVAGYALAWLIHGERRDREHRVPEHGRTSRGYAPHRDL